MCVSTVNLIYSKTHDVLCECQFQEFVVHHKYLQIFYTGLQLNGAGFGCLDGLSC